MCPGGSNHNEDGDSWLDGCDNCPHVANDPQLDANSDGVGDDCELLTGVQLTILDWFVAHKQ